jgi:hypothetical protein
MANLTYFRSPYSVGFDPNTIFMGTPDLLDAKQPLSDASSPNNST